MTGQHPRALLRELEQRARKRFGQHFLWRADVVARIVRGARVSEGDRVLEVGPGLGILTAALVDAGAEVTAVEIDRDLAAFLRERQPGVRVMEADATRIDLSEVCPGSGWKMVSNLPYNVGTTLVLDLVRRPGTFASLTVMLQREVVDRLIALPGSKVYGALSVQVQARCRARLVTTVPPSAFHPRPKVQSAVIRLELDPEPALGPGGEAFDRVVRGAFAHRRKTVANSLASLYGKQAVLDALDALGIEPAVRAERLDVDAFRALAVALHGAPTG